ncbi:MAG: hypothetical protein R3344_13065, partial [Acidobacteriota bacterium]|nr:hypothetical protein [Acidobacteriota bacterium]
LRGAGLRVPTSCTHTYAEALTVLGLDDRDAAYWAGRAALLRRPEDIPVYDRAFAVFFERRIGQPIEEEEPPLEVTIAIDTDDEDATGDDDDTATGSDDPTIELRFSATEILRHKDFAEYTDAELDEAHELMSHLRLIGSPRDSLRLEQMELVGLQRQEAPDGIGVGVGLHRCSPRMSVICIDVDHIYWAHSQRSVKATPKKVVASGNPSAAPAGGRITSLFNT